MPRWIWPVLAVLAAMAVGWLLFRYQPLLYVLAVLVLGIAIIGLTQWVPRSRGRLRMIVAVLGVLVMFLGWFGPVLGTRLITTRPDLISGTASEPLVLHWEGNALARESHSFDLATLTRNDVLLQSGVNLGPITLDGEPVLVSGMRDQNGWSLRGADPDGREVFRTDPVPEPSARVRMLAHRDGVLVIGVVRERDTGARQVVVGVDLGTGRRLWTREAVAASPMLGLTNPSYTDPVTPITIAIQTDGEPWQRAPGDPGGAYHEASWEVLDLRTGEAQVTMRAEVVLPVGADNRMLAFGPGQRRDIDFTLIADGEVQWRTNAPKLPRPILASGVLVDHDGTLALGDSRPGDPADGHTFYRLLDESGQRAEWVGQPAAFGGPAIEAEPTALRNNRLVTARDDEGTVVWEHTGTQARPLTVVHEVTADVVALGYEFHPPNPYRAEAMQQLVIVDRWTGDEIHRVSGAERVAVLSDGIVISRPRGRAEVVLYRP